MGAGYVFFTACCLICLSIFVCWLGALILSFRSKNKKLSYLIIFLGLVGFLPILILAFDHYTTVLSVSGSYHESFDGQKTTLTLNPNGTFHQQYTSAFGNIKTTDGKWVLHRGGFWGILFGHGSISFSAPIVHYNSGPGSSDNEDTDDGEADVSDSSLCFGGNADDCLTRGLHP